MVRVKICGLTNLAEARAAIEAGADAVGFVFAESSRRVEPEEARHIIEQLPPMVGKAGVFVNAGREEVERIAAYCRLDLLQFHGTESPADCTGWELPVIKAFRVRDSSYVERLRDYRVAGYLLDTYLPGLMGGSGMSFNWQLAREASRYGPVILAGGINAGNVAEAVATVHPYAIDVSSGVETEGRKDPVKIRALMAAVRRINDEFTG